MAQVKTYSQMSYSERLACRMAQNRAIECKVASTRPILRDYSPQEILARATPQQIQNARALVASGQVRPVIEVKCWNRTILILPSHAAIIRSEVERLLAAWVASGSPRVCVWNKAGKRAVSVQTVIDNIRDTTRINFPTNHSEAEDVLKALGFKLERLGDHHTTIVIGK